MIIRGFGDDTEALGYAANCLRIEVIRVALVVVQKGGFNRRLVNGELFRQRAADFVRVTRGEFTKVLKTEFLGHNPRGRGHLDG